MTADDKLFLIRFITRTNMFVHPVNRDTVVSFIHGYEAGKDNQNFTFMVKQLLTEKYAVYSSSDGWPGQMGRYARRCSWGWVAAFKQTGLEMIMADGLVEATARQELVKWVMSCLDWAATHPAVWLDKEWRDNWLAICDVRAEWFAAMWSVKELQLLVAIDEQLRTTSLFERILLFKLAKLRAEFKALTR